ncbi:hypothetical protein PS2_005215 [Malus domestica]
MMLTNLHVLSLSIMESQNQKASKCAWPGKAYGHRRRKGGVGAPGAGFAQGKGRGQGGRQLSPCHCRPIVYGQRRGNDIDLMREYHEAVAASLKYVPTLLLQDYVSVGDMISHIRRVVDVDGNRALTVLHRITFMMRENG